MTKIKSDLACSVLRTLYKLENGTYRIELDYLDYSNEVSVSDSYDIDFENIAEFLYDNWFILDNEKAA